MYGGTSDRPFQGLCQGNGAAGTGWLVGSAVLLRFLKEQGHGATLKMAISVTVLTIIALMFVDDGDFPTMARDKDESMASVMGRHQLMVDDWSGALGTSGGALKLSKCFCSLVDWRWKSGKVRIAPAAATVQTIVAHDPDGNLCEIEKLDLRRVVWTEFWGTLWSKLRYPLAALTFSDKEWGQLMTPMF